jgi:putative protease
MPYELVRLGGAGGGAAAAAGAGGKGKKGGGDAAAAASEQYLLSPKDMCGALELGRLVASGVDSLKIEGRMKSAEYVASVVGVYREMLDDYAAAATAAATATQTGAGVQASDIEPTKAQMERLGSVFSRGFTSAYMNSARDNDIMSYTRPNNRGQLVGRVKTVGEGDFTIASSATIESADVLEVWTRAGNFVVSVPKDINAGAKTLRLQLPRGAKPPRVSDRVFRVRSASAVFDDNSLVPKLPVYGRIELHIGEPAKLEFWMRATSGAQDGAGSSVVVFGDVVEPARTRAVGVADVEAHINRLGSEPFELAGFDVDLDDGVGIGFSALHHLRAQALAELAQKIIEQNTPASMQEAQSVQHLPQKYAEGDTKRKKSSKRAATGEQAAAGGQGVDESARVDDAQAGGLELCVIATNPQCARAAKRAGAQVYVPALNFARGNAQMCGQRCEDVAQAGYPSHARIVLPVADHDQIEGTREVACGLDVWQYANGADAVVAQALAELAQKIIEQNTPARMQEAQSVQHLPQKYAEGDTKRKKIIKARSYWRASGSWWAGR